MTASCTRGCVSVCRTEGDRKVCRGWRDSIGRGHRPGGPPTHGKWTELGLPTRLALAKQSPQSTENVNSKVGWGVVPVKSYFSADSWLKRI